MADCEAPSFSLGLDLLFDSEPQIPAEPINPKSQCGDEEYEEIGSHVPESDPETRPEQPRVLRRLRRGLPQPRETAPLRCCVVDDEIEEFSSQEDDLEELHSPPVQYHSMCSTSKISLNGCGAISKSSSEWKAKKNEPASTVTATRSTETSRKENIFAKFTASPLRRFQLIDCDSDFDNPSTSDEGIVTGDNKTNQTSKDHGASATTTEQLRKCSDLKPRGEDLWKDFCPIKSFHIPTPALDEMCEEYFHSVKDEKAPEKLQSDSSRMSCSNFMQTTNGQSIEDPLNEAKPLFPCHQYFLHHDPRIQKLVCDRLPNFFPLGVNDNVRNRQNGASAVDYMGQFGNKEPSKRQATQQVDFERNPKRGKNAKNIEQGTQSSTAKKNSRKSINKPTGEASQSWVSPKQGKGTKRSTARKTTKKRQNVKQASSASEGLHDSGSWVDPRSSDSAKSTSYPGGQSAGHWYTGPNGRRVYVNKNGHELTGQIAYRQYKKDKGGNGKGKRKNSSKKKD